MKFGCSALAQHVALDIREHGSPQSLILVQRKYCSIDQNIRIGTLAELAKPAGQEVFARHPRKLHQPAHEVMWKMHHAAAWHLGDVKEVGHTAGQQYLVVPQAVPATLLLCEAVEGRCIHLQVG